MSYFPDMDTVTMGAAGPHVRAIGWLDLDHPFPVGEPRKQFLGRLQQFVEASRASHVSQMFGLFLGGHECEFCDEAGAGGMLNCGVPDGDVIFVAPELVVHYLSRHHYLPPEEFVTAVMRCPMPGTIAYQMALLRFRERLEPSEEDVRRIGESIRTWVLRYRVRQSIRRR